MMLKFDKYFRVLQVPIVFLLMLVFCPISTMAMQYLDTLEMEILFAERAYLKSDFGEPQPDDGEVIALGVKVLNTDLMQQIVGMTNKPVLVIGNHKLSYPIQTGGRIKETGEFVLVFYLRDLEQIQEGDEVFLYMLSGIMFRDEPIERIHPRFSYDIVVDKRWKVFGGMIEDSQSNVVPYTTLKITGGNTSLTRTLIKKGSRSVFSLVQGEGEQREAFFIEENTTYVVEVLANELVLFSQTFTRETAAYPRWEIKLDTTVDYYEIKGFVYDSSGNPLPEVMLTVDEYHTTTTDEKGYYQIPSFFAGSYTLVASKEGYHFSPVEFTVGEGQPPVTIDLVEERPNQCLLYAVHDIAKSTAQLLTVDLSADELEITPLDWKLNQAEISLAVGNFDSDGAEEIVTAAQKGGHTITFWELDGQTMGSFDTLLSGILLAAGDLDGDGPSEIIAASRSSDRNTVNVYTANGKMLKTVKLFDNKTRIAPVVSDVDGDGKDDIIAGSLLKANQVAIYYSATQRRKTFSVFQEESRLRKKSTSPGKAKGCEKNSQGNQCDNETTTVSELAPSQDSGLSQNPEVNQNQQSQEVNQSSGTTESVKTVDTTPSTENQNASKHQNSATVDTTPSTGSQDSSENQNSVIVESVEAIDATPSTKNQNSSKVEKSTQLTYGVQVATGDFDGDGTNEIVAAQASKGSRVEIYHLDGTFQRAFDAFDSQQGVVITVGNVVGDSSPEIIVGEAKGHLIRVFSADGKQLFEWEAIKRGEVSSLAVFGCLPE
jgi:hypothetical protein